ncbi:MAG: nitrilase-related carbon-nitrogen hydrolase, partial [Myxococcales bacterium]
ALGELRALLPATRGMIVSVGLPLLHHNALFNAAALLCDGELLGFVAKRHLAGDGIHYEPRWFKAWPEAVRGQYELDGRRFPIGDVFFDCGGVRIGFEICEDAWVARRPGAEQALKGVDVLLNPSASHFAFGKQGIRSRFVLEGSRAFNVTYVYANLLGNEAGRAVYDGGALIASAGRMLAVGRRFSYEDVLVTSAVVDVELTRMGQVRTASFRPALAEAPAGEVHAAFTWPDVEPEPEATALEAWEESPRLQEEEFLRAQTLALFDYGRKSRSGGFVVSLSGGADSAVCATLVALMVELGSRELGLARFVRKFGLRAEPTSVQQTVRALLVCAYQATRNSGAVTRNAARAVAESIGAEYHELDVD